VLLQEELRSAKERSIGEDGGGTRREILPHFDCARRRRQVKTRKKKEQKILVQNSHK
jgi:hypothetical protein